jgi:hypothetical protein
MIENMNFETIEQDIIKTFESLRKKPSPSKEQKASLKRELFERVRKNVIETFKVLKKEKPSFNDINKVLNVQTILQYGEHFFSKSQLVELSCLINTLLFNYLNHIFLTRLNQLNRKTHELNDL